MMDHNNIDNNINPYRKTVSEIKKQDCSRLSDSQIKENFKKLKGRAGNGESTRELIPDTFSIVYEAIRRTLGITPFDAQLVAAVAMADGRIIEFPTGEGKTLVAVFVACAWALSGKGVHILTFNDYLAQRDALWMGPVYHYLDLSVCNISEEMSPAERKSAYDADITYVTAKQAGFDYLRSFLAYETNEVLQRPFHAAILDEADSIMIDEARIPLVIAGDAPSAIEIEKKIFSSVSKMQPDVHFKIDRNIDSIYLTECGAALIEEHFGLDNLYDAKNLDLLTKANIILQAQFILIKDIDYIVKNDEILIVDEFTGRIMKNRQWSDGLHAAVEIKEGLIPKKQSVVMNRITLQNFLGNYPEICGMTGTARSAAREFREFYNKTVTVIPPNKPCIRIDHPDVVFQNREAMYHAIIEEIKKVHQTGRPVLVGTKSIEESEKLFNMLEESTGPVAVLNAKNDAAEAKIISNAGMLSAITISTNMAGRGVDIHLGGENPEDCAKIRSLGGLYIIGTSRYESVRIDNQLRGRAGRQGDPGESRFFISLDDSMMIKYGIYDRIGKKYKNLKQDESLQNQAINKAISYIQKVAEGRTFDAKLTLAKYSCLAETQRKTVHQKRADILYGKTALDVLQKTDPGYYQELAKKVSERELIRAQREIELFAVNQCWADYLLFIDSAQDGVQMISSLKGDPLAGYNKRLMDGFEDLEKHIHASIMDIFNALIIKEGHIQLSEMEINRPSSTRTYLVQDGTEQQSLVSGISAGVINPPLYALYLLISRFKR